MQKSVFTGEYGVFLQVLREVRQARGVTQADLAARLGETQSWVSKCERGEHRLDIVELRTICRALGVSLVEVAQRLEDAL
jgi:transcriptional regulator with XRE-family HTH domain